MARAAEISCPLQAPAARCALNFRRMERDLRSRRGWPRAVKVDRIHENNTASQACCVVTTCPWQSLYTHPDHEPAPLPGSYPYSVCYSSNNSTYNPLGPNGPVTSRPGEPDSDTRFDFPEVLPFRQTRSNSRLLSLIAIQLAVKMML